MIYFRISNAFLLICALLKGGESQDCSPNLMISRTELQPEGTTKLRCVITGNTCVDEIVSMNYQKRQPEGITWEDAYIIFKGGSAEHKVLAGGYTLEGRSSPSVVVGDYDLDISKTDLADSGPWRCVYTSDNTFESNIVSLEVTDQCSMSLSKSGTDEYVIATEYSYTCACPKTYPKIEEVTWTLDGKEQIEIADTSVNGFVWDVQSTIKWTAANYDQVPVSCRIEKEIGSITWISNKTYEPQTILTPAIIEESTSSNMTVSQDKTLAMFCIVSGSDIKVEWTHNQKELSDDKFSLEIKEVSGNFAFGQKTAKNSTITWIPPPSGSSELCKKKTVHQGVYQCKAEGRGPSSANTPDIWVVYEHVNACISDGGLAGIIIGCVIPVIIIVIVVVYCGCK